jgi:hypothetical protein
MGQESDKDSKKESKTHHVRICHDRELHVSARRYTSGVRSRRSSMVLSAGRIQLI